MKKAHKRVIAGIIVVALGAVVTSAFYGSRFVVIGTAYTAKMLCSGVFVSEREPQSLLGTDLSADDLAALRYIEAHIDRESREVTATFFKLGTRKAVYREGCGCTVVYGEAAKPDALRPCASTDRSRKHVEGMESLETVDRVLPELDIDQLDAALEWAFLEPNPALLRRTRGVVVVYKGRLVAERYADQFRKETPLIAWSMTKSVVNALVGILVKEGKVSLNDSVPMPGLQEPSDAPRKITWDQLLRMTSGLQFDEDYSNPFADVTYMLLGVPDAAAYAAAKPFDSVPGARWAYSSGNSNILAYAARQIVGDSSYLEFPRRALFDRLGMTSAVMETDAAGTFVGSSFMYATARDWARFGLLYLYDGVWAGQRILPEGWVAYTRTAAPNAPDQRYGAHFWLRIPKEYGCGRRSRSLPADAFHAVGHEGQFVTIIPSRQLVLVRLGFTRYPCAWDHRKFVHMVLKALAGEKPANSAPQGARQKTARP
jgi:CubicO group peptidase (beta-lactamase class C family)